MIIGEPRIGLYMDSQLILNAMLNAKLNVILNLVLKVFMKTFLHYQITPVEKVFGYLLKRDPIESGMMLLADCTRKEYDTLLMLTKMFTLQEERLAIRIQ